MPSFKSIDEYNEFLKGGKKSVEPAKAEKPKNEAPKKEATGIEACTTAEEVLAFAEENKLDLDFGRKGFAKMKEMVVEAMEAKG